MRGGRCRSAGSIGTSNRTANPRREKPSLPPKRCVGHSFGSHSYVSDERTSSLGSPRCAVGVRNRLRAKADAFYIFPMDHKQLADWKKLAFPQNAENFKFALAKSTIEHIRWLEWAVSPRRTHLSFGCSRTFINRGCNEIPSSRVRSPLRKFSPPAPHVIYRDSGGSTRASGCYR